MPRGQVGRVARKVEVGVVVRLQDLARLFAISAQLKTRSDMHVHSNATNDSLPSRRIQPASCRHLLDPAERP